MMGWDRPISLIVVVSGFLVGSNDHDRGGAIFKSHIDGSRLELTPERSIAIQEALGRIAMVFDHVVALPNEYQVIREACERSIRWLVAVRKQRHWTANSICDCTGRS